MVKGQRWSSLAKLLINTQINNAVVRKELPKSEWKKYFIKIMYESDSYEKERRKLKEAEYLSDLETDLPTDFDDEGVGPRHSKRNRKHPRRYSSSKSSEDGRRGLKTMKSVFISSSDNDEYTSRKTTKARPVPPKMSAPNLTSAKFTSPHETPPTSNLVEPQPQSSNESIIARETGVLMVLEELRTILESLDVKINTLQRNSSTEEQDQGMLEGMHFPLNDRNDTASLESKLLDSSEEKKVLNCTFFCDRGANLQDTVRCILRYAVTNSLAVQYKWCGKGEKQNFGILKLKDTIIKSVCKHPD